MVLGGEVHEAVHCLSQDLPEKLGLAKHAHFRLLGVFFECLSPQTEPFRLGTRFHLLGAGAFQKSEHQLQMANIRIAAKWTSLVQRKRNVLEKGGPERHRIFSPVFTGLFLPVLSDFGLESFG